MHYYQHHCFNVTIVLSIHNVHDWRSDHSDHWYHCQLNKKICCCWLVTYYVAVLSVILNAIYSQHLRRWHREWIKQTRPKQSAVVPLAVCKHVRQIYIHFWRFLRPVTLTFDLFEWKLALRVTHAMGVVYANFDFLHFFVFEIRACMEWTDEQTLI